MVKRKGDNDAATGVKRGSHDEQRREARNPHEKWILGGLTSLILTLILALVSCY